MAQNSIKKGNGPAVEAASEVIDCPVSPNLPSPGAPAFPRMRRVLGRKRLMRETSGSDSDSDSSDSDHSGEVVKKFRCCLSVSKQGDHSGAVVEVPGVAVETADVEYIKTERVVLTQTFLTSWCVRRG